MNPHLLLAIVIGCAIGLAVAWSLGKLNARLEAIGRRKHP